MGLAATRRSDDVHSSDAIHLDYAHAFGKAWVDASFAGTEVRSNIRTPENPAASLVRWRR
jgi:hypothetical protein